MSNYPVYFQVSLSEYLMQDQTPMDTFLSMMDVQQSLGKLVHQHGKGGLISARVKGVWVCPEFKNKLHVCRGSLLGERHQYGYITLI